VVWVRRGLEVRAVAGVAIGGRARKPAVGVTRRTRNRTVRPGERKTRRRVIEVGGTPCSRRVTRDTCRREPSGDVVRVGASFEIRTVARVTIRGRARKPAVGVTRRTRNRAVRPSECESRQRVIEAGGTPGSCRVTRDTSRREPAGDVVGVGGGLEVRAVACVSIGGRARKTVVRVARRTCNRAVRPRERKTCRRVIEASACPRGPGRVVAVLALGRVSERLVVRSARRGVIARVARHTGIGGARQVGFVRTAMTAGAFHDRV